MKTMKIGAAAFAAALCSAFLLPLGTFAYAQEMTCEPTLDNLKDCITHHYEMDQIFSKGIYRSLIAMANEAVEARDDGDIEEAIEILEHFIQYVEKHTPRKIDPAAADHMIHHATGSIEQLLT